MTETFKETTWKKLSEKQKQHVIDVLSTTFKEKIRIYDYKNIRDYLDNIPSNKITAYVNSKTKEVGCIVIYAEAFEIDGYFYRGYSIKKPSKKCKNFPKLNVEAMF